jgi:sigma-B regulation protein RsbQ
MSVMRRNNVTVWGDGTTPMMFAHGYGCDQHMWRNVAPAFAPTHRIVLFDHVGSGRSDLTAYDRAKYSSLQGYADDVLEICHELDLRDVVFVGHSVSSMIGILAALREPDRFSALILIGPSPRYIDDGEYVGGFTRQDIDELLEFQQSNYLGWSSTLAPIIMGNADQPELAEELTTSFCSTNPDVARQFAAVTFLSDNRADLPGVSVPALILQCSDDAIAPERVGEYVHANLPDSTLVRMRATGHCPHLSAPQETIEAIRAFLRTPAGVG